MKILLPERVPANPNGTSVWDVIGWGFVIVVMVLMVTCVQGCASCQPECCAECPARLGLVERPPEIVTILPPVVAVPEVPELETLDLVEDSNRCQVRPVPEPHPGARSRGRES